MAERYDLRTLDEAAAKMRVSVRTIQRLIAARQIRPIRIGHRNPALTARIYAHVVPEAQRAAVASLERRAR